MSDNNRYRTLAEKNVEKSKEGNV